MSRRAIYSVALWALVLNIVSITPVSAGQNGAVGPDCQYHQIQDAIDDHIDEIHVLTGTYAPFEISGKVIEIIGGYPYCAAPAPTPGAMSVVSGAGLTRKSVIYVRPGSNNNTILNLHNLEITSGNAFNGSNGNGGGISFHGHGELDLTHVNVIDNYADNGGGIDVDPDRAATGPLFPDGKTVAYLSGSYIANNKTASSGAGIRIQGPSHLKILKDALSGTMTIAYNIAGIDPQGNVNINGNMGGGLLLMGQDAIADISSTDPVHGLIINNQAGSGGGIAVANKGVVRLFTTVPTEQVEIGANLARFNGGGIYLKDPGSRACAFGYSIVSNTAQDGGAIYADRNGGAVVLLKDYQDSCSIEPASLPPYNAVFPSVANQIEGNVSSQAFGAAVDVEPGAGDFKAEYLKLQYNSGRSVAYVASAMYLGNCLITNNASPGGVIVADSALIDSCTVTNNTIDASSHYVLNGNSLTLQRSIFWQPDKQTSTTGGVQLADSILNDASTFPSGINVHSDDPDFISLAPFQENYRLSLDSPAVDYADTGLTIDLDHHDRGVVRHGDASRRFDIGAYERQTGATPVTFPVDENFDELGGPEQPRGLLPVNWTTAFGGAGAAWTTTGNGNGLAATIGDADLVGESSLLTPVFTVFPPARLSFDQLTSLETNYDGAVLEIAIGEGAFVDIVEAGGQFLAGAYNATIRNGTLNPIADRPAWSGDSGDFQHVSVDLPAVANGRHVQLRWRVGTDNSNYMCNCYGYWIDNIHVDLGDPADTVFANGFEDPSAN